MEVEKIILGEVTQTQKDISRYQLLINDNQASTTDPERSVKEGVPREDSWNSWEKGKRINFEGRVGADEDCNGRGLVTGEGWEGESVRDS